MQFGTERVREAVLFGNWMTPCLDMGVKCRTLLHSEGIKWDKVNVGNWKQRKMSAKPSDWLFKLPQNIVCVSCCRISRREPQCSCDCRLRGWREG